MTVYLDVSSAVHAKAGLARYAETLASHLRPLLGDRLRLFQNSLGRAGPLPGWEDLPQAGVPYGYKPWRGLVWLRSRLNWSMDELLPDAELFHATEHLLPPFRRVPTILTVHDLVFEHLPEHHKLQNRLYLRSAMPMFCRNATHIIAISEATRDDVVDLYGVPPDKITVIPEAAAPQFRPQSDERVAAARARYGLPQRYILAVGTLEPRKNLGRLVDACGPLIEVGLIDALVLVGGRGWLCEGFFEHIERVAWRDRVMLTGFVADDDLPAIYAGAMVTAQPSVFEGFGLPVLEAMASGCPVCASNMSSLPEVGGPAARYFDPLSVAEMSACLRSVVDNPALQASMRDQGLARAAQYSWERTARETVALYEKVIGER